MNTSSQNEDLGQPVDPKALPLGPESVKVYVQDMTIVHKRESGAARHVVNVTECPDLDMVLISGAAHVKPPQDVPAEQSKGVVLVLLDVDGEQDSVLYTHSMQGDVEAFGAAIEALTAARRTADQIGRFVR